MAFLYGPGWRVPDPSFRYADPPEGCPSPRRLAARLPHRAAAVEPVVPRPHGQKCPGGGSEFARWVGPADRPRGTRWWPTSAAGSAATRLLRRQGDRWSARSMCSPEARGRTRPAARRRPRERHRRLQADELRTVASAELASS